MDVAISGKHDPGLAQGLYRGRIALHECIQSLGSSEPSFICASRSNHRAIHALNPETLNPNAPPMQSHDVQRHTGLHVYHHYATDAGGFCICAGCGGNLNEVREDHAAGWNQNWALSQALGIPGS